MLYLSTELSTYFVDKKRAKNIMINDYVKRRNKRRLIKFLTLLIIFFPMVLSIISLSLIQFNLLVSPLNIISVQILPPKNAKVSYLSGLGYFSSSWRLKVTYDDEIVPDQNPVFYNVSLYHGPLISKKAFQDENLTRYQRFYPVYFELTPEKVSVSEPNSNLQEHIDSLEIKLSWLGYLTTTFHSEHFSLIDSQNIFSLDNLATIQIHYDLDDRHLNLNNSELTVREKWSIFGKKSFFLDFSNKAFQHPKFPMDLMDLKFQFIFNVGEPFSDIDFNCQTYINNSLLTATGSILKVNTKEFLDHYFFDIDVLLHQIMNNKILSFEKKYFAKSVLNIFNKTNPQFAEINYSFIQDDNVDVINLYYDQTSGYSLEADYQSFISEKVIGILEPFLEENS